MNWEDVLNQIIKEVENLKIGLLGLSEVRWKGSGEKVLSNGDIILFSGKLGANDRHESGVGIMLSRRTRNSLLSFKPISDRIITARFKVSENKNLTVVQCYAPTEVTPEPMKDEFYSQLDKTLEMIKPSDITILMGDMNAKIGSENGGYEHVMGRQGVGERNNNGDRFVELCGHHNLVIGGSLFKHKLCHKVTWHSAREGTENQIDHISITKNYRNSLLDVRTFNSACCGSDHDLLISTLRIKLWGKKPEKTTNRLKPNIHLLKNSDIRESFVENFSSNLQSQPSRALDPVNVQMDKLCMALSEAAKDVLGEARTRKDEFISPETWLKIDERKKLKTDILSFKQNCPRNLKDKRNRLNREIRKSVIEDRKAALQSLAIEAQAAADRGDMKEVFRITTLLSMDVKPVSAPVKDTNGVPLLTIPEQVARFREHFSNLLNNSNLPELPPEEEIRVQPLRTIDTNPPTVNEIVKAIRSMKNGKAAGNDGLPPELLKADAFVIARALYPVFRKIWTDECYPEDWMEGTIIKIPKKGDLSNVNNWRGITVLSVPSKIFNRIIYNRLIVELDSTIRKQQAGFRPYRSCVDQICSLRIIIEQSIEFQSPLFVVFIDYQKAFDSINREAIWRALRRRRVPEKITNLIKQGYNGFSCRVLHHNVKSQPFETISGVRQGCLLSPLLFLLVLDDVMRNAIDVESSRGLLWNIFGERLEDLDFADDIALIAQTHSDMQNKLDKVIVESKKVGLNLNVAKTKEIRINDLSNCPPFQADGQNIDRVDHFEYLGSFISATDGGTEKDIISRIAKARYAFSRLRRIWKLHHISLKTKLTIFNSCVKSVLLYGSETWYVKDMMAKKLSSFFNRCLRKILGVWWPNTISNKVLHEKTQQLDINVQIKEKKYGWIGHTLRKDKREICYKALLWNPQGRRKVGAPRRSWRNTINRETGGKSIAELSYLANVDKNRVGVQHNLTWKMFTRETCGIPTQNIN